MQKPYTMPRTLAIFCLVIIMLITYMPDTIARCRSSSGSRCCSRSYSRSCSRSCCGPSFSPWFGTGFYPGFYPVTPWGPAYGFCGYPYPYFPGGTFSFGFSLGL